MAWFHPKAEFPYWMDEGFSVEEAQKMIGKVLRILQYHRYVAEVGLSTPEHPVSILTEHPDLKRKLAIRAQKVPLIELTRYEFVLSVVEAEGRIRDVKFILATDGPDTVVTAERIFYTLERYSLNPPGVEA